MADIKIDGKLLLSNIKLESTSFKTCIIGGKSFEIKIKGGSIVFDESEVNFLLDAFRSKIEDDDLDDDFDDDFDEYFDNEEGYDHEGW